MSITFWCPNAPTNRIQPYPEDDPEFWDDVSVLPTVTFSCFNGPRLLRKLELPEEYGEVEPAALAALLSRMDTVRLGMALTAQLERRIGGSTQHQQDLQRWDALYAVFKAGHDHQQMVAWG